MTKDVILSVMERIHLLNTIPKKGSILENKIIRTILEKIEFGAKEYKELEFDQNKENGNIKWNNEKAKDITIKIEDAENEIIIKAFKILDEKKEMPLTLMSLYEKFEWGEKICQIEIKPDQEGKDQKQEED